MNKHKQIFFQAQLKQLDSYKALENFVIYIHFCC